MALNYDLPMQDYLALDALGSGTAYRVVTQSPFHARYQQLADSDNCKTADIGSAAHKILLEGTEDGIVLVDAPDWRTKAAKEERDAAYVDCKIPLLGYQIGQIRKMVDIAREFVASTEIWDVLGKGKAEVTVDWKEGDILCKARPDYLSDGFHISVKTTTASANPALWIRRQLTPMGYDFGLAFYERGLKANGIKVEHRLLVIEQNPPYGCSLIALGPDKKAIATAMVKQAIETWKECVATGRYPGYSTETHFAEATPWELAEAEERELEMFAGSGGR